MQISEGMQISDLHILLGKVFLFHAIIVVEF